MMKFLKRLFSSCDLDQDELTGLRRSVIAMGLNPAKLAKFGHLAVGDVNKTLVLCSFQSSTEYFESHGFSGEGLEKLEVLASNLRLVSDDYAKPDFPYDNETHNKIRDIRAKNFRSLINKAYKDARSS